MEDTVIAFAGMAFDALAALTVLWLARTALASPDLFKGVVLFIAFGLVLALVWVRIDAPDIALAEAAIGAGLTGALLLAALSRLNSGNPPRKGRVQTELPDLVLPTMMQGIIRGMLFLTSLLVFCGLSTAILILPAEAPGLSIQVADSLSVSGVKNPVTAVIVNFRAYDTLLEMGVLLLVVIAVWSLSPMPPEGGPAPAIALTVLVQILTPVMILVAGYLLWVGAHAPGGAFQAGSVLAAAAVLMLLSGHVLPPSWSGWPFRLALGFGLTIFIGTALFVMFMGNQFLEFPKDQAGIYILLIEGAATLSIGATLAALFMGGRPQRDGLE